MKLSIFGTGYVGLVTGACLADVGHHVLCVDVNNSKILSLRKGEIPIYEPGLSEVVHRTSQSGNLEFTTILKDAVDHGEVLIIAVGTPSDEDGSADLSHVMAVAKEIGDHIGEYKVVVNKSTVPVGTAELVRNVISERIEQRKLNVRFDVCSNPEFLKEGMAIDDFTKAARIVVGADGPKVFEVMRRVYAPYNRNHNKIIEMDARSAELTKYAANAMLATRISFMNEMSRISESLGADIEMVRIGIGSDPRIGYHFIYPGCGFGGSCFPKDIRAIADIARRLGVAAKMVEAVEAINERQKEWLFERLHAEFEGKLSGKTIAVWGLAFKPNTDDMREAPSRVLMERLWRAGAHVSAFDPEAMNECRRLYGERSDLVLHKTPEEALDGADALAICTEWKMFRTVTPELFRKKLRRAVVVDGRNLFDPTMMRAALVRYISVGRPVV